MAYLYPTIYNCSVPSDNADSSQIVFPPVRASAQRLSNSGIYLAGEEF